MYRVESDIWLSALGYIPTMINIKRRLNHGYKFRGNASKARKVKEWR